MAFETKYKCGDCAHIFYKMTENDPRKSGGRLPACPECKKVKKTEATMYIKVRGDYKERTNEEREARTQAMISSRKPPAMGKTNFTKAMDATAEIVMQDYGMTNLQDNLRAGDSMAPKLEHRLESKVDEVFKAQKPLAGQQAMGTLNNALMQQINAGKFKGYGGANDVVSRQQESGIRVPTTVLYEHNKGDRLS